MGWTCTGCGQWIEHYLHYCNELQGNNTFSLYPEFNYECPDCHGKFNYPAMNCTEEGTSLVGFPKNYRCPFCSKKMKGLES